VQEHGAEVRAENDRLREENAGLRKENERLLGEGERLLEENKRLKAQLDEARRAGKRQGAPFRRRERKAAPKKPGRKAGHAPAHRDVPDHVDEEKDVPLGACPHCGGEVDEDGTDNLYEVDMPPVKPHVTKYVTHHGQCKQCRRRVESRHPEQASAAKGAASVVLGPRVLATSIDLKERIGVPYRKVVEILGCASSSG